MLIQPLTLFSGLLLLCSLAKAQELSSIHGNFEQNRTQLESTIGRALTEVEFIELKRSLQEIQKETRAELNLEDETGVPSSTAFTNKADKSDKGGGAWSRSYLVCGDAKASLLGSYGEGLGCYDYFTKRKYYLTFYSLGVDLPKDIKDLKKVKNLIPSVTLGVGVFVVHMPNPNLNPHTSPGHNTQPEQNLNSLDQLELACTQTSLAAVVGAKVLRCQEQKKNAESAVHIHSGGVLVGRDLTFEESFEAKIIEIKQ